MPPLNLLMILLLTLLYFTTTATCYRHLLHQPLFPLESSPPTQPPSSSPQSPPTQISKLPFSSSSSTPPLKPFFPSSSSHSPPPPPSPTSLTSFPANISSILFPKNSSSSSSSHRHVIAIAISVSVTAFIIIASAAAFLYYRRRRQPNPTIADDKASRNDSLRLFPPNTASSDAVHNHRSSMPNTSREFLYLGTLVSPRRGTDEVNVANTSNAGLGFRVSSHSASPPYQRLGSPELKPLPPLPKHNSRRSFKNSQLGSDDDEEEFFSPRGYSASPKHGSGRITSPDRVFKAVDGVNFGSRSFNSRTASYPCSKSASPASSWSHTVSPALNLSPRSLKSKSPDLVINFSAPSKPPPIPVSSSPPFSSSSSRNSDLIGLKNHSPERNKSFVPVRLPPPPPPLPPPRFWEAPAGPSRNTGPPVLFTPSRPAVPQNSGPILAGESSESNEMVEKNEETPTKPKLKPLHWDKVKASSDRAMVWDRLKSSSFQLNEEMIETLFMVNNSSLTPNDNVRRQILPSVNQENRVLDPKKSQNIAILLRALNVTIDEVCEALLEGNSDGLGTELLESLLKMAPTKEEERKLREFKDESPFKLGPAEKFLKAVLDIPFAFKRVDAMLYIANFDSEVDYLKRSFETVGAACEELRNSKMFLKLLEAVLKTGNRMNVGTNRGDAHAFKLDTLLKLVDVKGTDGKTTLLHFVVQEIIRAEGSRLSGMNQNQIAEESQQTSFRDDVEFRKLGLQVVSGLSGELTNVKKAATMDSDVLSNEVAKIAAGITKIAEVVKLIEGGASKESSKKFFESMSGFLKRYWTRGGSLRSVPVGGGCRRNKKSKSNNSSNSSRSKSPVATGDHIQTGSNSITNNSSDHMIGNITHHFSNLPPSTHQSLPFLASSIQSLGRYGGAGNMGLNFNEIQQEQTDHHRHHMGFQFHQIAGGNNMNNLSGGILGGGHNNQWRNLNLQHIPFLGGTGFESSTSTGLYPFQTGDQGVDHQASTHPMVGNNSRISTEQLPPPVKTEDNHGLSLTRPSLGTAISPEINNSQFWGGNLNAWTDLSGLNSSSTSHLL